MLRAPASPPSIDARRMGAWIALALAIGVGGFGIVKGTRAVGGSDSSCYALMAEAFARGRLQPTSSIAAHAPWPDAARTAAPAGFIPSPVRPDGASPICAPGFSLFLAPFLATLGREGIFLVTPLAGAVLVWLTFRLSADLAGPAAGLVAALILATTPVFLFQVIQPMNDVAVAALWLAVLVSATAPDPSRAWLLGGFSGLAVLVRPNLAASVLVVGAWLGVTSVQQRGGTRALVVRNLLAFLIAGLPSAAVLLALNLALYGHPMQSGYGRVSDLFALEHVWTNARFYGTTILATQLGFPLVGLAGVVVLPKAKRSLATLALALSASVTAMYLPYTPFVEWWYLRFLLPAMAAMTALAAAALVSLLERHPPTPPPRIVSHPTRRDFRRAGAIVLSTAVIVGVAVFGLETARDRSVFDLQRIERRFRTTGEIVRDRLPSNAVFITVWHSGTLRFHAGRPTVLWDSLEPAALDPAIHWLSANGMEPYIVVEQWEEPRFRDRFAGRASIGDLAWPPRFEIEHQIKIFHPADRDIYGQGGRVNTEYVIPRF